MLKRTFLHAALCVVTAVALSACVESKTPLITDAKPLLGESFEVHLYENFNDNKAADLHTATYRWSNGQYERTSGLARDVQRFVAQRLDGNVFLIQSTSHESKTYNYWVGHKLAAGVYSILPVNENDANTSVRESICGTEHPEGVCRVSTYAEVAALARATAKAPEAEASLGVLMAR